MPARTVRRYAPYAEAHVRRAEARELERYGAMESRKTQARAAAEALKAKFGDQISVHLFGSVLDESRFRLDSDIDLGVEGIAADRYYEAWSVADAVLTDSGLDLVRIEDAPGWLVQEIMLRGERLV